VLGIKMETIIYRKVDKLVVGHSFPRKTAEQTENAVVAEIISITNSELGGEYDDYAYIETESIDLTKDITILDDLTIEYSDPPAIVAKRELEVKLADDSITFAEMKELMRLKG
jgi:hypothetical protein